MNFRTILKTICFCRFDKCGSVQMDFFGSYQKMTENDLRDKWTQQMSLCVQLNKNKQRKCSFNKTKKWIKDDSFTTEIIKRRQERMFLT